MILKCYKQLNLVFGKKSVHDQLEQNLSAIKCLINHSDNRLTELIRLHILCQFMIENKSNSRISVPASENFDLLSEIGGLISVKFIIYWQIHHLIG